MLPFQSAGVLGAGRRAGIVTDGLALHLDAGDADSYQGIGHLFADLSPVGNDYVRGSTGSSDGNDPTFAGVAGAKTANEYFFGDGNDFFTEWVSAGISRLIGRQDQAFTAEFWIHVANDTRWFLFTNSYASTDNGIYLVWSHGGDNRFRVWVWPGNTAATSASVHGAGSWYQVAFAGRVDGSTVGRFVVDGQEDGTWTLNTSWSSGQSTRKPHIGGRQDAASSMTAGTRLAILRLYDRMLSAGELARNFAAERARFGI